MRGARLFLTCCLTVFLGAISACQNERTHSMLPTDVTLKAGDVVFRSGRGIASLVVVAADLGGSYSHVGIVVDSCGVPMIVHAVPDEPDFDGDTDRVKMDSPDKFFGSERTTKGEICRPQDSIRAARAAGAALQVYRRGVLFDHDYDDSDTTRMYCTELVVYALQRAGFDLSSLPRQRVSLPVVKSDCVMPSAIHGLPFLTTVTEF